MKLPIDWRRIWPASLEVTAGSSFIRMLMLMLIPSTLYLVFRVERGRDYQNQGGSSTLLLLLLLLLSVNNGECVYVCTEYT